MPIVRFGNARAWMTLAFVVFLLVSGCEGEGGADGGADTSGGGDVPTDVVPGPDGADGLPGPEGADTLPEPGAGDTTQDGVLADASGEVAPPQEVAETGAELTDVPGDLPDEAGEVATACCDPATEPGAGDNPFCVEGHACCADGAWACNEGDGSSTCVPSGEGSVITGGGSSLGMCGGACKTDLTLAGDAAKLVTSGWDDTIYTANSGVLSVQGQAKSATLAAALVGVTLQEVYGCPDCADGGASYVALLREGVASSHAYEYGAPPEALADADAFVFALVEALGTCTANTWVTPAAGCAGAD